MIVCVFVCVGGCVFGIVSMWRRPPNIIHHSCVRTDTFVATNRNKIHFVCGLPIVVGRFLFILFVGWVLFSLAPLLPIYINATRAPWLGMSHFVISNIYTLCSSNAYFRWRWDHSSWLEINHKNMRWSGNFVINAAAAWVRDWWQRTMRKSSSKAFAKPAGWLVG